MAQTFTYLVDSSGVIWQIAINTDGSLQQTEVGSLPSGSASLATKTVQDVIDSVSQDIRSVLGTTGSDAGILTDYVNRVSLKLLRQTNWTFLLSAPQYFMTRIGVTDYWLGATGTGPTGSYDTGLNITDLRTVKPATVYDRSNFRGLGQFDDAPLTYGFTNRDNVSVLGPPRAFKITLDNPSLLSVFPAPDNQNSYTPVPDPPLCSTSVGGALSSRTYFVKITIVDSNGGESAVNTQETKAFVPANSLLVVKSPKFNFTTADSGITYTGYKVYASIVSGNECVQNGGASIAFGSDFTESTGGLSTGTSLPPSSSTLAPMGGYLIEFRYFRKRTTLSSAGQTLQIPDDFFDVVVAGVNELAYRYLQKFDAAMLWKGTFQDGIREMIRDKHLLPNASSDFMRPDDAATPPTKNPIQNLIF